MVFFCEFKFYFAFRETLQAIELVIVFSISHRKRRVRYVNRLERVSLWMNSIASKSREISGTILCGSWVPFGVTLVPLGP